MREQRSPGCWHLSTPPRYAHLCTQLCREGKGLGYGQGTEGGHGVDSTSHGHHHSWHQVSLGMGLGTHLSPTLGLCWGMLPPGSEAWDIGACGAAQWGRVGFCRAGKQRPPMWAMPALLASLQLRHTVALPDTGCSAPLSACREHHQPGRDSCGQPRQHCGARMCPPWGAWRCWGVWKHRV